METGTTDADVRQMIALHVDGRDDEAQEVASQIAYRTRMAIESAIEAEKRCAKKAEMRDRDKYCTYATRWGGIIGCIAGVGAIIWHYDITGNDPDVLISSATTFFFGVGGAAVGRYIAR